MPPSKSHDGEPPKPLLAPLSSAMPRRAWHSSDSTSSQPTAQPVDYVVTGATGLVGNNLVRLLTDRGQSVRAVVRFPVAATRCLERLPIDIAVGVLDDPRTFEEAISGATVVVHAAAMVHCGWRHAEESHAANVALTRVVAGAARRAGARLVHVSSVDALGLRADGVPADEETPPGGMVECPYVVTKRAAEAVVLEEVSRGLDACIVNPVYMLGPWDWKPSTGRMLLEVGAGRGLFAPSGANDFVDVRDVAAGIVAAAERGRTGRRYILGGHPLSYFDAWGLFARITGRMQPLGIAPWPIVKMAGLCGDLAALVVRREPPVNSAAVAMSLLNHTFNCARAEAELGYFFRPLEITVVDAWQWFIDHGLARSLRTREA
jgi:dihydroflavonol-4-reductase